MGNMSASRRNDSHFLSMWSAIRNYDDDALLELLKHHKSSKLKFSIRSCLLHSSIIRGNLGAVRMILEGGFDMRKAARNKFFPLVTAAEYSVFGQQPALGSPSPGPNRTVCYEIIRLLFEHGAEMAYAYDLNQSNPLRFIHRLAVTAPDAAELLFEKMSPEEMNYRCCDPGVTPLSASFLYVCFYYKQDDIVETRALGAVFSNAILPLLRFGGEFGPQVFHQAWLSSRLCIAVAELNNASSIALYGRSDVIIQLLIAALQTSELSPKKLDYLLKHEEIAKKVETAQLMRYFVKYVRSLFPLTLQAICRIAILRRMPPGTKRIEALQQLNLPTLLLHFLNFKEFDLPSTGR